ncbi:MAG TPA: hypothetical protein VGN17_00525 [Bryobacteraceae bacterium]
MYNERVASWYHGDGDFHFLVVGSNNFAYASGKTEEEAIQEALDVWAKEGEYGDPESDYRPDPPTFLYVYKAAVVGRVYPTAEDRKESGY